MRIAVRRYRDDDAPAIERFNQRLEAAGCEHRLYREDLTRNPTADLEIRPVNDSFFVAADGDEVRGGSWLREQLFWVEGGPRRVGWMKYPVAESLIDRTYAGVPGSMILQLMREQPNLMALGMGGHDTPIARLLAGIKWKTATVSLHFRVCRPARVLRGLTYARRKPALRFAMDVAAWSGAGWVANRILQATARKPTRERALSVAVEPKFAPWADAVWERCRDSYRSVAVRDAKTLDFVFRSDLPDVDRLRMSRGGTDVALGCTQVMPVSSNDEGHFGSLRVGLVLDLLAEPSDALPALHAAVEHLASRDVDLIMTYFCHDAWIGAARAMRLLAGPSTLAFYRSPAADELLLAGGPLSAQCHLTASDCHGAAGA